MTNIERPIYNNFSSTNRNLCGNSIENMKVLSKIDGIKIIQDIKDQIDQDNLDPQFIKKNFKVLNHLKTACLEQCDSTLLDKEYPSIKDPEELRRLMSEVLIRFDTSPSNYMQDDYFALLKVVLSLFNIIADPVVSIVTDTPDQLSIKKEKSVATINLNVANDLDDNTTTEDKKIATVEQIRKFINNKLEWQVI